MKRLLTLLFFAFFAITTQAQTVPNLPQGVVPFGTQLWRAPDGDIWTGNEFEGYTNLGNWQRVADSLQVKINWSDTTIIASKEWVEGKLNSLPPSGVLSVTGDGVDNTDPANPVLSYPDPSDIGALAPGDNVSDLTNDAGYLTTETDPVYSGDPASGITQNDIDRWDDKQDAITGAATTVVQNNLTPSRALISNGSGKIAVSPVSSTELAFLDGVSSNIQDQLDAKIPLAQKGASDGVAPLGPDGKVPNNYLNFTGYTPKGSWDASTNTPTLADGAGTIGWVYTVSVAGTQDLGSGSVSYNVGDRVVYTADNIWVKEENTQLVVSVNGYQGVVNLNKADVGLGNVDNTSDLDKPISTAVQNALDLKLDVSEISNYYTKTNLQTSGQAQVHWDNITNVPGDLGAQTLSLGVSAGQIAISGGNAIQLPSITLGSQTSINDQLGRAGVYGVTHSTGSTGFYAGSGAGILVVGRSNGSTAGAFMLDKSLSNDGKLRFSVGTGGTDWTPFETFASEEHVASNYFSINPNEGSPLTNVGSGADVFSYTKAGAFRSQSGATNAPNSTNSFSYLNLYGGSSARAMLAIADGGSGYNVEAPYFTARAGTNEWKQLALKSDIPSLDNYVTTNTTQTITGTKILTGSDSPLRIQANTTASYLSIYASDGTTRKGYIGFPASSPDHFFINNDAGGLLKVKSDVNGLTYSYGSGDKTVWHAGNLDPATLVPETVISTTVNFTIDWQNDTAPNSGGKTYAELHGDHFTYSAFYVDGSGAEVNYSPAVKITRNGSGNITTVQFGDIQTGNIVIK